MTVDEYTTSTEHEDGVEVPIDQLSAGALDGVIEAVVLREGTDYGERETSISEKKLAVMEQLIAGEAVVVFDATTSSCNIVQRPK